MPCGFGSGCRRTYPPRASPSPLSSTLSNMRVLEESCLFERRRGTALLLESGLWISRFSAHRWGVGCRTYAGEYGGEYACMRDCARSCMDARPDVRMIVRGTCGHPTMQTSGRMDGQIVVQTCTLAERRAKTATQQGDHETVSFFRASPSTSPATAATSRRRSEITIPPLYA